MSAAVSDQSVSNAGLTIAVQGLEPESALAIRSAFETMFAQADEWVARAKTITVTSVDQKREMKMARESRLALREIRVKAEHARKRLKEDSTRRGKAIDGIANVLKALIEPIEEHLLEQETFAERAESARKDALKAAREETLRALGADPTVYANLGETSEGVWSLTLDGARAARDAKLDAAKQAELVRVEAEKIAAEKREAARVEAARVEAERIERERVQAEDNARLKAEAVAREAAAQVERERATEQARIEREAAASALAAAKAEAAAATAAAEAARHAEERETKRKHEADAAARQAAALAPDREKLAAFAATLRALTIPDLTTETGKAAAVKVAEQIAKMAAWVQKTGASL
jgi:hypothetical protein